MPTTATITSTDYWTPGSRETITSAKWNAHMAIWRGHLLPVDGSTSAAANGSYDLGSSDHKWRNAHLSGTVYAKPGYSFSTITAALSITSQHVILCDASTAAYTCTLPAAANNTGTTFLFTKIDTGYNQITIDANGSEQINDTATTTIATYGEMLELICDGAKWYKKSRYIDSSRKQFSPTASWSTNVTFDGRIQRVGGDAIFEIQIYAAGAVTTGSLVFTLPTGLGADYNRLAVASGGQAGNDRTIIGMTEVIDAGSAFMMGAITLSSTTTVTPLIGDASSTYLRINSGLTGSIPMTWAATDQASFVFRLPIIGWEA